MYRKPAPAQCRLETGRGVRGACSGWSLTIRETEAPGPPGVCVFGGLAPWMAPGERRGPSEDTQLSTRLSSRKGPNRRWKDGEQGLGRLFPKAETSPPHFPQAPLWASPVPGAGSLGCGGWRARPEAGLPWRPQPPAPSLLPPRTPPTRCESSVPARVRLTPTFLPITGHRLRASRAAGMSRQQQSPVCLAPQPRCPVPLSPLSRTGPH